MLLRWGVLPALLSLLGCAIHDPESPSEFLHEGHVWSVSLYEGVWGSVAENPEPDTVYGTFAGLILDVRSRDAMVLTKEDGPEAKSVASAYCTKLGGTFDGTYTGQFADYSKVWQFAGACSR